MDPHLTTDRSFVFVRPVSVDAVERTLSLGDLVRFAVKFSAYLAGVVGALFIDREPVTRNTGRITPRPVKRPPPEALPLLTEAIVGSSKFTIASVMGAPRSAVVEGLATIESTGAAGYLQTDTWYYPMPRHGQVAMAILFTGDIACRVDFFHAPGIDRFPRPARHSMPSSPSGA